MKGKILYIFLLLVILWVAVTTDNEFSRFLFVFELLFAACMGIWVHVMAGKIKASFAIERAAVFRGERDGITLSFQNPTVFPVGDIRITARITGGGEVIGHTGVGAGSRDSWNIQVQPVHCGEAQVTVTELRIFDYIGLFSARLRTTGKKGIVFGGTITILPQVHPLHLEAPPSFVGEHEMSQELVADRIGMDSQEIFDTRYYRQGDLLKNIHWKLSAKADDLLVKEFSMPADQSVEIYLDMGELEAEQPKANQAPAGQKSAAESPSEPAAKKKRAVQPKSASKEARNPAAQAELLDAFWDLAASAGSYLSRRNIPFAYTCSPKKGELLRVFVANEERLYPALEGLVGLTPQDCLSGADSHYAQGETFLRITLDGQIYEGEKSLPYRIQELQ